MKVDEARLKILICDDEPAQIERWKKDIGNGYPGDVIDWLPFDPSKDFDRYLGQLTARRRRARGLPADEYIAMEFDEADILILDYDILKSGTHAFVTGEELAYLARCYSTCGVIVAMNQIEWSFDLRLVDAERLHSFADLNIRSDSLPQPGLWQETWPAGGDEFRPWSWPCLPRLVSRLREITSWVESNASAKVLEALGLNSRELLRSFSNVTLDAFCREGSLEAAMDVTFANFLDVSPKGKHKKDKITPDQLPRVCASRVLNWLREDLLPSQDVIVDLPHLATRIPELAKSLHDDQQRWNETTRHQWTDAYSDLIPCPWITGLERWFDFPVWSWPACSKELNAFNLPMSPAFVFCEDTSNFQPSTDVYPIETDVSGVFSTRWIRHSDGSDYGPRARLFR